MNYIHSVSLIKDLTNPNPTLTLTPNPYPIELGLGLFCYLLWTTLVIMMNGT